MTFDSDKERHDVEVRARLDERGRDFYHDRRGAGRPHQWALVEALNDLVLREAGMSWAQYEDLQRRGRV